jgi:hypothetical protein
MTDAPIHEINIGRGSGDGGEHRAVIPLLCSPGDVPWLWNKTKEEFRLFAFTAILNVNSVIARRRFSVEAIPPF